MQKKTLIRNIVFILILMWMSIVFQLSNQQSNKSTGLSQRITKIFVSEEKVEIVEPYIRKIAHLSEYALGGILFLSFFLTYDYSDKKRILLSLLFGTGYATLDEIHQLFIDGRAGQIKDVYIDTIGVLIGICIAMIIYKISKQNKEKI